MDGITKLIALTAFSSLIGFAIHFLTDGSGKNGLPDELDIYEQGMFDLDSIPAGVHPLIIELPDSLRYGSTKGSTRNWGANFFTYYPRFSSPGDPQNSSFGMDCAGYCNGRISVAVNYRPHQINNARGNMFGFVSPNMADFIGRAALASRLKINGNKVTSNSLGSTVTAVGPQLGFDEGYQIDYPGGNGASPHTENILLRFGPDHTHYDLIAECYFRGSNHHCSLHFSLNCDPAIYVNVHGVDIDHVTDLADVRNKTDAFVTSMVRTPPCH